ncbi:ATP-binding protein [Streptosporangium soli]|nr:ATP-binding protein [Streptosporangium sp. KLBMP 9127]
MAGVVARTSHLDLNAHPSAASHARAHVRATLTRWRRAELIDTAELLAGELVANAVKASGGLLRTEEEARLSAVHVSINLYRQGSGVVLEVWDADRTPPVRRDPAPDDEGGRGLLLVELMCQRWGFRWPISGGKVVWCLVGEPQPTGGAAGDHPEGRRTSGR